MKTGEPGENHLTIRKQNLAFPHVTRAGLEHSGEKPNGLRVNSPIHLATEGWGGGGGGGLVYLCICMRKKLKIQFLKMC